MNINKNDDLILTCEVESYPSQSLEWILPGSVETSFSTQSQNLSYSREQQNLIIYNMRPNNGGKYTCSLKNDFSVTRSINVYVLSIKYFKN